MCVGGRGKKWSKPRGSSSSRSCVSVARWWSLPLELAHNTRPVGGEVARRVRGFCAVLSCSAGFCRDCATFLNKDISVNIYKCQSSFCCPAATCTTSSPPLPLFISYGFPLYFISISTLSPYCIHNFLLSCS